MAWDSLYHLTMGLDERAEYLTKKLLELTGQFRYSRVYLYGQDEARGEALRKQR